MTALIINALAAGAFVFALSRDREKAKSSVLAAFRILLSILPMLVIILLFIGLLFSFVSEEMLKRFIGDQSGPLGVLLVAVTGSVLHIPAILAFPLSASLLEKGASITVIATFITTLTMIGTVSLPLEIKELGGRFAFLRNGISFVAALIISLLIGILL